ncbi:MAG: hypothetical protein M0Z98_13265 [Actinomycetales bacterium]|nr:hypothetical protein [Actinomycetales bacterium]
MSAPHPARREPAPPAGPVRTEDADGPAHPSPAPDARGAVMTTRPGPGPSPSGDPRAEDDAARRPPTDPASGGSAAAPDEPAPTLLQRAKALWCAFVSGLG